MSMTERILYYSPLSRVLIYKSIYESELGIMLNPLSYLMHTKIYCMVYDNGKKSRLSLTRTLKVHFYFLNHSRPQDNSL
jgi:hypothetical protein